MTLQATIDGVTSTLRSLQRFGQEQRKKVSAANDTDDNGLQPVTSDLGRVSADLTPTVPESDAIAPAQTFVEAESNSQPRVDVRLAPAGNLIGPVTTAVTTVANVAVSVPGLIASLPTSATPVADVITSVQEMLTSVTDAVVPLAQVPSDLVSLLGLPAVRATTVVGRGMTANVTATDRATYARSSPQVPRGSVVGGSVLPGHTAPLASVGDIALLGLIGDLPVSGIASPAQNVVEKAGPTSFLEHTVSALLVPASLSALVAVALPGVGGLLILCAAGIRIGYRQAKALMEVRRAGIASFAGPGPLGIVRSGSLIAMRPRGSRIVRRKASLSACRPLEQAA
jgi:hypothetical protein